MRKQIIRTEPLKIFKEQYLTKKGLRLKSEGVSEELLNRYRKNRYLINEKSKQLKEITHLN